LDRVAFEERRQGPAESFDDFYISLRRLADAADICGTCFDGQMATRIMAGVRDSETKKKPLALSQFPTAQTAVNLCRSEESARENEKFLSQTGVASIQTRQSEKHLPSSSSICNACGWAQHSAGQTCPAVGKTCHICGKVNHFAPRCPEKGSKPQNPAVAAVIGKKMGLIPTTMGTKQMAATARRARWRGS
jgi:hypothetical protein